MKLFKIPLSNPINWENDKNSRLQEDSNVGANSLYEKIG